MDLNPIDIAFLAVMLYGVYKGLTQGFIGSVLFMLQLFLAVFIALRLNIIASKILSQLFGVTPVYAPLFAFVMVLGGVFVGIYALTNILDFLTKSARLGSANRALGVLFWIFLLTLGFSTVLYFTEGAIPLDTRKESLVYPFVQPIANVIWCKMVYISPALEKILDSLRLIMEQVFNVMIGECGGVAR